VATQEYKNSKSHRKRGGIFLYFPFCFYRIYDIIIEISVVLRQCRKYCKQEGIFMEVRFARGEDIPGIIKLLQQVGRVHHEGRPDLFRVNAQKYSSSQVLDMLGKMPIFVAVENGVVLGYGFCMFEQFRDHSVMTDRTTLYIDDICVLE
jgi:hypothetical protein